MSVINLYKEYYSAPANKFSNQQTILALQREFYRYEEFTEQRVGKEGRLEDNLLAKKRGWER